MNRADVPMHLLYIVRVLIVIATVLAGALIFVYQATTRGHWRRKQVGIHLMSQAVVIFLLLLVAMVGRYAPPHLVFGLFIVLYCALIGVQINQIRLTVRASMREPLLPELMEEE